MPMAYLRSCFRRYMFQNMLLLVTFVAMASNLLAMATEHSIPENATRFSQTRTLGGQEEYGQSSFLAAWSFS